MINVYDPSITRQYVTGPHENGFYRFQYHTIARACEKAYYSPYTATDVYHALSRLQAKLPLGWIGYYEILALPVRIVYLNDSGIPTGIAGERYSSGFIALSAYSGNLDDLLAHELIHEWSYDCMRADDWVEFFELTGLVPESDPAKLSNFLFWHRWPGELLAEHVSHALFDTPINGMMAPLSPDVYDQIRRWALALTPAGNAEFVVHTATTITVVLTVGSTQASINDQPVTLDVPARVVDGRTLVPVRFVSEAFDASVEWIEETQSIVVKRIQDVITLRIGEASATVNGTTTALDVAPVIVDRRTLVPLRFVAEALGAQVDYDDGVVTIVME